MTTQEMVNSWRLEYDLNGSAAVAGFEDSEIVAFLNKAQLEVIESIFLEYGPTQLYSVTETAELQIDGYDAEEDNKARGQIPIDYMFSVAAKVIVTRTLYPLMSEMWVRCDIIKIEDADNFISSSMNNVILVNPVFYIEDGMYFIIKDSSTTIESDSTDTYSVKLKYIRTPNLMDLTTTNSELSKKWHQDIVNKAVLNAMAITNDFRVRSANTNKKTD